jgi:DNA polymerase III delta prime subunit
MSTLDQSSVLDRVLDPFAAALTPHAATQIVNFRADEQTQARLDELADKANEGSLTGAEREEYDKYLDAIRLIAVLQAKARRLLQQRPAE